MFASARVIVNLYTHVLSYMLTHIHTQSLSLPFSLSHTACVQEPNSRRKILQAVPSH
jgi:hypothetical protein